MLKIFNPMAIDVQRIALTHEKLYLRCCSVGGFLKDLMDVLGPFRSFCKHEIFMKLNLLCY